MASAMIFVDLREATIDDRLAGKKKLANQNLRRNHSTRSKTYEVLEAALRSTA